MADKIKVNFDSIEVIDNGEWRGQGELYWDLKVNGNTVSSRSSSNPLKKADGDDVDLSASYTATLTDNQILVVSGAVREKDNLDKDEYASLSQEFTKRGNWGIGSHTVSADDGNLVVKVHYRIERA